MNNHTSRTSYVVRRTSQQPDGGSTTPRRFELHPGLVNLRVALVHDFLTQHGGAERVLDVFHQLWPTAPIHTLVYDQAAMGDRYAAADVRASFIQRLPLGVRQYKWYLGLMPRAIESFDLSGYDLVLSDASAFAKGVLVPEGIPHICYLHTPTRYLWSDRESYLQTAPVPFWARPILNQVIPRLQRWDVRAAARPDVYVANSNTVAKRLEQYYQRQADAVLFPPVEAATFRPAKRVGDYWFTVARLEPYKRLDLILDAFAQLGWPLKVAGVGSKRDQLAAWSRYPNIVFVGHVTDAELATLYAQARAFVFAANEDAGIVPLEAMAAGRPVLAYGAGGSLESVVAGTTGEFFAEQSVPSLTAALKAFRPEQYDPSTIRAHAEQFDVAVFADRIQTIIQAVLTG